MRRNSYTLVVFLIGVSLLACSDITEYSFKNYSEIVKDKTIKSAAVPNIVIKESKDIFGWYSLDFPMEAVEFKIPHNKISDVSKMFGGEKNKTEEILNDYSTVKWKNKICDNTCLFKKRIGPTYQKEYLAIKKESGYVYYWAHGRL